MTSVGNEHWTCNKCLPGEEITKTVISRTLSSIDLMGSSVRRLFVQLPIDSTINATSLCNMQTVNWVCTEKEGLECMHTLIHSQ